jgi:hypothetical protein
MYADTCVCNYVLCIQEDNPPGADSPKTYSHTHINTYMLNKLMFATQVSENSKAALRAWTQSCAQSCWYPCSPYMHAYTHTWEFKASLQTGPSLNLVFCKITSTSVYTTGEFIWCSGAATPPSEEPLRSKRCVCDTSMCICICTGAMYASPYRRLCRESKAMHRYLHTYTHTSCIWLLLSRTFAMTRK